MTAEPIASDFAPLSTSLWQRLSRWFGLERAPQVVPAVGPLQTRREADQPIAVPARGGALTFLLTVVYRWHSEGMDSDSHREWVGEHSAKVRRDIRVRCREIAAEFPPHHVEVMQSTVNKWSDQMTWNFDCDGLDLTCRVTVSVAPDHQIRERLVNHWKRIIDVDNENELNIHRANLAGDLTKRWSAILADLQNDPMAAPAAQMTEQQLAIVVGDLRRGQVGTMRELLDLLDQLKAGKSMGQYEFIELFDVMIEKLRKHQGL